MASLCPFNSNILWVCGAVHTFDFPYFTCNHAHRYCNSCSDCLRNTVWQLTMKILCRRPLCNNNPSSAPHINGKCFFLCWRCTGAVVGAFGTIVISFITDCVLAKYFVVYLLALPAVIDYFLTRAKLIQASNVRRFISGVLLGIPLATIALIVIS